MNRKTIMKTSMLAAVDHCLRHSRYGNTATGKTLIAVASANMFPAIHGRACCSSQKPYSMMANRTRLGWPRSNMSKTKVTVRNAGSANSQGPGIRPEPVIALDSCAVIHQATMFNSDRQL